MVNSMKLKFNLYGKYRIFLLALILIAAAVFLFIYLPGEGFPDNKSHQDGLYLKPVASDIAAAGNMEVLPGMEHMDEIDYNTVNPLEYLNILKQHPSFVFHNRILFGGGFVVFRIDILDIVNSYK